MSPSGSAPSTGSPSRRAPSTSSGSLLRMTLGVTLLAVTLFVFAMAEAEAGTTGGISGVVTEVGTATPIS